MGVNHGVTGDDSPRIWSGWTLMQIVPHILSCFKISNTRLKILYVKFFLLIPPLTVFTRATYAMRLCYSAVLAVIVSVRLSVTSRLSTTAKPRITRTTPYDSPGTSFLMRKISSKFQIEVQIGDFGPISC